MRFFGTAESDPKVLGGGVESRASRGPLIVCGWGLARGGGQFSFQESENEGDGEGGLDISCGARGVE